jgi:glycosyltransferase involved in cell wall biosynthesis
MPSPFSLPRQKLPERLEAQENKAPVRILHVVGRMERAGLETWIMRMLRLIDRERFQIDILVHSSEPGAYDADVRALGCRIFACPFIARPWTYAAVFKRILAEQGPYDAVHSHVHFFSGYVLRLAKEAKVPCRIAHSHNDHNALERQTRWRRQIYLAAMKRWIRRFATHGLATSRIAALDMFGPEWDRDSRIQVLFSGLDLSLFETEISRAAVRQTWSIPPEALAIGHVGRFEAQKNHGFLVQVVAVAMQQQPNLYLMLVGQGSLRSAIERQVQALGIGDRVIFAEPQTDISSLLLGVFDLFLFPSLHEGLGVALLEAQAAGLPCLISETIPPEAEIIPHLVKRMSLEQSADKWAETLLIHARSTPRQSVTETLPLIRQSPFDMKASVLSLAELYCSQAQPGRTDYR